MAGNKTVEKKSKKNTWVAGPVLVPLVLLLGLACGFFYRMDLRLFYAALVFSITVAVAALVSLFRLRRSMFLQFDALSRSLEAEGSDVLSGFVLPLLVCREGQIIWYNAAFAQEVLNGKEWYGVPVSRLLGQENFKRLQENRHTDLDLDGRRYAVFNSNSHLGGIRQTVYYFLDQTKLSQQAKQYELSRPAVLYVLPDNLEQILNGAKDSERTAVTGAVQREVEQWAAHYGALFQQISSDRYLLLAEDEKLEEMMKDRFSLLAAVKHLDFGSRGSVTLTVGVSRHTDTLAQGADAAGQALDMALGRGGDQAAVKDGDAYTFFGGTSEGVGRGTRVRTRVVATSLTNLMEGSENILLMGHRFADMDSFGACLGLCGAARKSGKPAWIVLDRSTAVAGPAIRRLEESGHGDWILSPKEAEEQLNRKTLLIIADTHRGDFVESREIYEKATTVVVIDHHRKTVGFIDKAVIFYHESRASSACELVAELLQYMGSEPVGKLEAEAMLAGIMLDTRSFVLRTGVRTFEACAYLRSKGADPVSVKNLFANTMDVYRARSAMVSAAELYGDCAIACTGSTDCAIRIAAAQAADELLTIEGVVASFALYPTAVGVNISARSLGAMNVQLVMEALGGGGNLTMAACQLEGISMKGATDRLKEAIDQVRLNSLNG